MEGRARYGVVTTALPTFPPASRPGFILRAARITRLNNFIADTIISPMACYLDERRGRSTSTGERSRGVAENRALRRERAAMLTTLLVLLLFSLSRHRPAVRRNAEITFISSLR